jgi:hypothetical protein
MTKKKNDGYNATVREVTFGKEDHGMNTAWVTLDHDAGSTQGFGGLVLDGGALTADFKASVLAIFGATSPAGMIGKRCRALYCFGGGWNENIEGLETDLGRFTLNGWRKKHFPETKSVLEQKREDVEQSIFNAERMLRDRKAQLRTLNKSYTDLEKR